MFRFSIHSPAGTYFDGDIEEVVLPTEKGPTAIQEGYTPIIIACLKQGVLRMKTDKATFYFAIFDGVCRVEKEKTVLICGDVENGKDIDMARALASRDRALDRIQKKDEGVDLIRAQASLRRALARIDAKRLYEGGAL